jgi:hypothetical protein
MGVTIAIVVAAVVAACVLIPVCTIVVLALLGPAIGSVFSNIVTSLPPAP